MLGQKNLSLYLTNWPKWPLAINWHKIGQFSGVTLHVGAPPHRQRPLFGAPPPLKVEGKIEQIKLF